MGRFLSIQSAAGLAHAFLAFMLMPVSAGGAYAGGPVADAGPTMSAEATCVTHDANEGDPAPERERACDVRSTPEEIAAARAYVVETSTPGYTMTVQGPHLAVARLHPDFVVRVANAIREARNSGLLFVGIFSAYRPPAFGIGGFSDKFSRCTPMVLPLTSTASVGPAPSRPGSGTKSPLEMEWFVPTVRTTGRSGIIASRRA